MDTNVGKNLSAWDDVLDGNAFGGYPLVCSYITIDSDNVQYSLSGDLNDEPELGIKPFAKNIVNQVIVLDTMSKTVNC
eukprot:15366301-Ditylum_brightwellii.AAC.1